MTVGFILAGSLVELPLVFFPRGGFLKTEHFLTKSDSLVVETFNLEKNGREAYFIPLETSFFLEKHIQNPLKSPVGKSFYGCSRFCIIQINLIIMTNHFCHRNYTVAAANDLS